MIENNIDASSKQILAGNMFRGLFSILSVEDAVSDTSILWFLSIMSTALAEGFVRVVLTLS
jgi:hypothetical protein